MVPICLLLFAISEVAATHQWHSMERQIKPKYFGNGGFVDPQYFDQRLDHFDGTNAANWSQAYYVNDTFWAGPKSGAPVFLCVGGEGPPFDGSVVQVRGSPCFYVYKITHSHCHGHAGKCSLQ